jgi:acetyltransferase-like isoleucine patch superfamily enzyme
VPPLHARLRKSWYREWANRETGASRFAALGERSVVLPPALILNPELISVGSGVHIHPGAFISVVDDNEGKHYGGSLTIGDGVRIGFDMSIGCAGSIDIGDDVLTADRVFIGDTYHAYQDVSKPVIDQGLGDPRPVKIGSGAFLGINCAILPGVTLGEGAYIGANAVVTRDVPDHALAVGNPARVVRRFDGEQWVDVPREG